MLAVRRWRSSHLLLAWIAYWALLVAATLGGAIAAGWRATHSAPGHGSIGATLDAGVVHLTIVQDAVTTWAGSAGVGEIAFWLVVPPLLLWLAWLAVRPRPAASAAALDDAGRPELGAAPNEAWPARPAREADRVRRDAE